MKIKILFFASIQELTNLEELELNNCNSILKLRNQLADRFPGMRNLTYAIAVNQEIRQHNDLLSDGDIVALLPPFSGG